MPITTVILDFDGTLASSLEGIWTCMCETLAHYNFTEPSLQQVRATIGLTLEASMHQLTGVRCEEVLTSEVVKFYRALHTTKAAPLMRLFEGAIPALAELRTRNIFTLLVSNKGRAGLHQLITQLEIANYIDIILSAEDVTFRKPDARLYTEHIAPLRSAPNFQTLVVGDTETDILFAKNANLLSCWATYGYGDEQRCKALSPDFELQSLTDLPALITNFTK
ncbi:phosphoglycolate phosphatase [Edaphobacter aggregans]|uniref:phosphoglycolate phosphatase n=1 Tax=Edaphobacter aggregans TaxID=570835 RepID=A0A428MID3_9BACT|nr:HAD family hydrolase [Edaphobacter aggregans]RSL16684.1 phosphoglycolate phosphatase [Edaphobacter aggregans]